MSRPTDFREKILKEGVLKYRQSTIALPRVSHPPPWCEVPVEEGKEGGRNTRVEAQGKFVYVLRYAKLLAEAVQTAAGEPWRVQPRVEWLASAFGQCMSRESGARFHAAVGSTPRQLTLRVATVAVSVGVQ